MLQMFPALFRTNLILTQRYISTTVKQMADPSTYVLYNHQQKTVSNLIEEFADNLINMRGKCMDIGCGPGEVTKHILLPALDQNAVMIGTDVSKDMVEYANKNHNIKNRLEFEVFNIETKELPQKYVSEFDHIFSFYTLHYCNDTRQVFENIYRMLRPNGSILVLFVASHVMFEILKNMAQDTRFASYMSDIKKHTSPYQHSNNSRKELKELVQKVGFTVNHCSRRELYYSECLDQYAAFFLSIFEFLDKMPCDLKEEFKKDFTHQLTENRTIYRKDENQKTNLLLLYNVLIVFAQKV